LRLDLTVNILTNHGFHNRVIKVFGGPQLRPNIHIDDIADLYVLALEQPDHRIDGRILNAGYENHSVEAIADIVRGVLGADVDIEKAPTDDMRSYQISSERIKRELGFIPRRTIEHAVRDLVGAFEGGRVPEALEDSRYYNVRRMQERALQ
jgi:nucleoside-diphosphate-sugar epimerase